MGRNGQKLFKADRTCSVYVQDITVCPEAMTLDISESTCKFYQNMLYL